MTERERQAKRRNLSPATLAIVEQARKEAAEQIQYVALTIAPILEEIQQARTSKRYKIEPGMFRSKESFSSPILDEGIRYDRLEKELFSSVLGKRYSSAFVRSKTNKRLLLVEKLLQARGSVSTAKLAKHLDCSTKEVQNAIQAINKKIRKDLCLKDPFICGVHGVGYRINPLYSVRTV